MSNEVSSEIKNEIGNQIGNEFGNQFGSATSTLARYERFPMFATVMLRVTTTQRLEHHLWITQRESKAPRRKNPRHDQA